MKVGVDAASRAVALRRVIGDEAVGKDKQATTRNIDSSTSPRRVVNDGDIREVESPCGQDPSAVSLDGIAVANNQSVDP